MKVLMKGNVAIAKAALAAGCNFYAGYPITPQNELIEKMSKDLPGKGVFIQAESEIAAINMVFGAALSGARAMTSSSSPGISLKQEGISYIAGAELPCVIVNMVRGGPGLGNIAGAQSDYFQSTRGGGHGDYRLIVFGPANVQELYDLTMKSFDLADKYRMPVMILGDGVLGQMMESLELKRYIKPKLPEKDYILDGCKGRDPRLIKTLYLVPDNALEKHNLKLKEKYDQVSKTEVEFEEIDCEDADIIIVSYGTVSRVVKNVVSKFSKVGFFRPITLWPFPSKRLSELKDKKILVVEMSLGQMVEDVKLSVLKEVEFLGRSGGMIPTEKEIEDKVKEIL